MDSVVAVLEAVEDELCRAETAHPTPIHNVAEGYAVILEELDEFWDEVKKKPKKRSKRAMAKELIQVAAMAIRTVTDCELMKGA